MLLPYIINVKITHQQCELYGTFHISVYARILCNIVLTCWGQVFIQLLFGESAHLWEPIDGSPNLEVYIIMFSMYHQVVLINDVLGDIEAYICLCANLVGNLGKKSLC